MLVAALSCTAGDGVQSASSLPNIVLIISDDHGWTDYGFMGHPHVRTPRLDELASQSMVFTRGYVPTALCRPSLATLATGLYPHQHGITGNDPPGATRQELRNLAKRAAMEAVFARNENVMRMLGDVGYVSHQSGKWWEGNPLDHGFAGAMTHGDVTRRGRHGDEGLVIGREGMDPIFGFIDAAQGTEEAPSKPFFIWYAPFIPHTPHTPPERLAKPYLEQGHPERIANYYAMVEWLDETVGELRDFLTDRGLAENTMILYVADNGWIQATNSDDQPVTPGKMSPYDMGIRSPVMVHWPGHVTSGRDDETLVGSIDFVPTILRAAGVDIPATLPGLDLLDHQALASRDRIFGESFAHTSVDLEEPVANLKYRSLVRSDGWKLILPYRPNEAVIYTNRGNIAPWMQLDPELYNLVEDPFEKQNVAADNPDVVQDLHASLQEWWSVPE